MKKKLGLCEKIDDFYEYVPVGEKENALTGKYQYQPVVEESCRRDFGVEDFYEYAPVGEKGNVLTGEYLYQPLVVEESCWRDVGGDGNSDAPNIINELLKKMRKHNYFWFPIFSAPSSFLKEEEMPTTKIQTRQKPQLFIETNSVPYLLEMFPQKVIKTQTHFPAVLHVIAVYSNPCHYKRRTQITKEFIERMKTEENMILYVVELVYEEGADFEIIDPENPHHLGIRGINPLWHKENMINIAVKKLLPTNWEAMAWIDADIEFENLHWVEETLITLQYRDIIQLFSHAVDMNMREQAMQIFTGFGYSFEKGLPYCNVMPNFWHPGYAWACNRMAYDKMGGLFDCAILGSADHIMSFCWLQQGIHSINPNYGAGYKKRVLEYQTRCDSLRLGYVRGVIRHYFHGSKANRQYSIRNNILIKHEYDPDRHLMYRAEDGLLIPTADVEPEMLEDIYQYFFRRKEDE